MFPPHGVPVQNVGVFHPDVQFIDDPIYQMQPSGNKGKLPKSKGPLPIEPYYEGFTLRKAPDNNSKHGSWARVAREEMQLAQSELANLCKSRKRDPLVGYEEMNPEQRQQVDRLRREKALDEVDPNAEWVLAYLKKETKDVKT